MQYEDLRNFNYQYWTRIQELDAMVTVDRGREGLKVAQEDLPEGALRFLARLLTVDVINARQRERHSAFIPTFSAFALLSQGKRKKRLSQIYYFLVALKDPLDLLYNIKHLQNPQTAEFFLKNDIYQAFIMIEERELNIQELTNQKKEFIAQV